MVAKSIPALVIVLLFSDCKRQKTAEEYYEQRFNEPIDSLYARSARNRPTDTSTQARTHSFDTEFKTDPSVTPTMRERLYGPIVGGCDGAAAATTAESYVEKRLKSPSTADFPWYDEQYFKREGPLYTYTAYVDAQNGFGATQRMYFKITLECTSKGFIVVDEQFEQP